MSSRGGWRPVIIRGTDDAVGFYEKLGFAPQMKGMSLIVGRYLDNGTPPD